MTIIPQSEWCEMLGIHPRTLRKWVNCAHMQFIAHPTKPRVKCLTQEQIQELTTRYPHLLLYRPKAFYLGNPEKNLIETKNLVETLESMEKQVAMLQENLAQLELQLTQERKRLQSVLQSQALATGSAEPVVTSLDLSSARSRPKRQQLPSEQRINARVAPLIEYKDQGIYILSSPQGGALVTSIDTPEWFEWLDSLLCFRFAGQAGHFTAYRIRKSGQRINSWAAHCRVQGQPCKCYLGRTDRLTIATLEQAASQIHSHERHPANPENTGV